LGVNILSGVPERLWGCLVMVSGMGGHGMPITGSFWVQSKIMVLTAVLLIACGVATAVFGVVVLSAGRGSTPSGPAALVAAANCGSESLRVVA